MRGFFVFISSAFAIACGGAEPSDEVVVLRHEPLGPLAGYSMDTLAETLVVRAIRITDAGEEPVAGLEIGWSAPDAELGAVVPEVSVTDADGYARARWVLGIGSGPQQATARNLNGNGMVRFDATARPGLVATQLKRTDASGQAATCAMDADGAIWCWGTIPALALPIPVTGAPLLSSLLGASSHTCGLTEAGALWCWGSSRTGWIEIVSGADPSSIPVRIAPDIQFASVVPSWHTICGVAIGGSGYCWGRGMFGDGNEGRRDFNDPVLVSGSTHWKEIVPVSDEAVFAISESLQPHVWGIDQNEDGLWPDNYQYYGVDHEGELTVPVPIPIVSGISDLVGLEGNVCGLKDGAAVCWGIGVDIDWLLTSPPGPVTVSAPSGQFVKLVAHVRNYSGLTSDGEIYTWGRSPEQVIRVPGRGPWLTIESGLDGGLCAILAADSTVYCWDFRSVPLGPPRPVPAPEQP